MQPRPDKGRPKRPVQTSGAKAAFRISRSSQGTSSPKPPNACHLRNTFPRSNAYLHCHSVGCLALSQLCKSCINAPPTTGPLCLQQQATRSLGTDHRQAIASYARSPAIPSSLFSLINPGASPLIDARRPAASKASDATLAWDWLSQAHLVFLHDCAIDILVRQPPARSRLPKESCEKAKDLHVNVRSSDG